MTCDIKPSERECVYLRTQVIRIFFSLKSYKEVHRKKKTIYKLVFSKVEKMLQRSRILSHTKGEPKFIFLKIRIFPKILFFLSGSGMSKRR